MENHLVRSIGESRLLTPYRISQLIVISERFLVSRTFIMKRSKRLKRGSRRISLTKRKCRFRCNVCNLCSREADLRFGSVHPKNGFLSLSFSFSPFLRRSRVADGTQPFGVSRSTRAECIFFEMIITSETFCFALSSPLFRFPFLLFIGSVHCAPLEPHCLERNAFVARLAVLVNGEGGGETVTYRMIQKYI